VILALIAERATGIAFHDLVSERVCAPAGMAETAFLRADALPRRAAVGYLDPDGARTNVLLLPVRGSGDGGIYSTVADIKSFWLAFFDGRIVAPNWVAEMVRRRSATPHESMQYGLGFWLHESRDVAQLVGSDAGVSFRSVHDPERRLTYTVVSNTSDGAWPIARLLDDHLTA
jgi:CubicO group peptidase (beta-lactamase class C family)